MTLPFTTISRQSIARQLMPSIMACLLGISLTSCDPDDDPYASSYLVGSWNLISINGGPVDMSMETTYTFNGSGYGSLGQVDMYGDWQVYPISWETAGDYLYVSPSSWGDVWSYQWQVRGNYLYLYDLSTGNNLTYEYYY